MLQKKLTLNNSTVKPCLDTSQAVERTVKDNVSASKRTTNASDSKESAIQATDKPKP